MARLILVAVPERVKYRRLVVRLGLRMEKKIHLKIDRKDPKMSLSYVEEFMRELQAKLPDEEVFFDGDSFAICSRPKRGR